MGEYRIVSPGARPYLGLFQRLGLRTAPGPDRLARLPAGYRNAWSGARGLWVGSRRAWRQRFSRFARSIPREYNVSQVPLRESWARFEKAWEIINSGQL